MAENKEISTSSSGAAVDAGGKPEEAQKMGYFDTVLTPPNWLTQQYVEAALRKYEGDSLLNITKYSIGPCTKPGDNFIGVIFRAAVTYTAHGKEKSESLILKIEAFMEGSKKDQVADQPYFKVEGRMYKEILPQMQQLLKNIGDTEVLAPGLIHYSDSPKILIFKDMATENFEMSRTPIGFAGASMVAKKLGKFHALSYFIIEELGDQQVETFDEGMFNEQNMSMWQGSEDYFTVLAELLSEWDGSMGKIGDKLSAIKPEFLKRMLQLYKRQPKGQGINVLNHGDFHIRNLLFRFAGSGGTDKTALEAIRFIDFQCSIYATPAIDLVFLLYVIADSECRENHRDELLSVYHAQFRDTLIKLGFLRAIPTLMDVQVEVLRNGIMELFAVTMFLSMFHMDAETMGEFDFGDPTQTAKIARMMYQQPGMKRVLLQTMPQLMYKGLLDI